jgi:hypothetical protein
MWPLAQWRDQSSDRQPLMNRPLIILGMFIVLLGLGWPWFKKLNLFRLPGDIVIDRPGFQFYFPITSMILISAVLTLIAWLMRR